MAAQDLNILGGLANFMVGCADPRITTPSALEVRTTIWDKLVLNGLAATIESQA
jgi:hypothetical protein